MHSSWAWCHALLSNSDQSTFSCDSSHGSSNFSENACTSDSSQLSAISCELWAVSYQLSAVICQISDVSCQLSAQFVNMVQGLACPGLSVCLASSHPAGHVRGQSCGKTCPVLPGLIASACNPLWKGLLGTVLLGIHFRPSYKGRGKEGRGEERLGEERKGSSQNRNWKINISLWKHSKEPSLYWWGLGNTLKKILSKRGWGW